MSLSTKQTNRIKEVLRNSLRNKFEKYNPEPAVMPFHTRLLGKDRLALYSFIHSLNTAFGANIFEKVAVALASDNPKFKEVKAQVKPSNQINKDAQTEIQNIIDNLATGETSPDKNNETLLIKNHCKIATILSKPTRVTNIDVKLTTRENETYLFDIKTAKPNAGGFKEFKRTLLE